MTKSLLLICTSGGISLFYADIESSGVFLRIVLPVVIFLSLIALALWFVILFHKKGIKQTLDSHDGGGTGGFGGDGGD